MSLSRGAFSSSIIQMRRRVPLVGVLGMVLSAGCASVPPAQLGHAAGTIAGMAIAPPLAPLGSLVGLALGTLVQKQLDQATETRERTELGRQLATQPSTPATAEPVSSQGQPIRVWVDERVQEGRLIAGHFDTREI